MKRLLYTIIATAGLAAIIGAVVFRRDPCTAGSCESPATSEVKAKATAPDITKIEKDIEQGALVLDVRTPEEFAEGHAVDAINIPYDQVLGGTYPTDDKDTRIYLYCRSGRRAQLAFDALKKAGYGKVTNLVSLEAWISLGGKTTK